MSVATLCLSHSPLIDDNDPGPQVRAEIDEVLRAARAFVADVDPTLVVSFGADHYNGFFYDLMPPFALCYAATAVGDFGTAAGPLRVPEDVADALARHALAAGIDLAISRGARVDHGATQLPEQLFGSLDAVPIVPVFVNGVAEPFAPMRRVRDLGHALGGYLASLDERVLVLGSGGLSHDPPVPRWAEATPEQRAFLLAGRHPTPEAVRARQQRVIDAGRAFAAGQADLAPLNPAWDEAFLDLCASGDLAAVDPWTPEEMTAAAGHSSHEVRSWVAAFSAQRAAGPYTVADRYYRPIPEWIAGFGFLTARPA